MNFTGNLIINIYSFILLLFILLHAARQNEKKSLQYKLFILVLQLNMAMLVIDIFSRFDGNPGTVYSAINFSANLLIFLLNPVLPSLWLLYARLQVLHNEENLMRWLYGLAAINAVNAVLVILSQFYGWFYYIDAGNIYHRGEFFLLPASLPLALTLAAFILIAVNRRNIEKKHFFALAFFPVLPFICVIIQILFYGISLVLNSVAVSLLIVFFNIQNDTMNTDYLTGAYNRKKLEAYMKDKIRISSEKKTFSAILIDLDNFKTINDTFGHTMGDHALEACVTLLKGCLRSQDVIARFGGDEFCILLDVSEYEALEATVGRINKCLAKFNRQNFMPYKLSFSIGYAVYDCHSHMGVEGFLKQIDQLMYENKRANKKTDTNVTAKNTKDKTN